MPGQRLGYVRVSTFDQGSARDTYNFLSLFSVTPKTRNLPPSSLHKVHSERFQRRGVLNRF